LSRRRSGAMKCPFCLHPKTRVLDKRDMEEADAIRRRRECLNCHKRFTTHERIEIVGFSVVKKDGTREAFDRRKLLDGLLRACEKRPIPVERIERLAGEIEADLRNIEDREVPSGTIGELVMDKLRNLDRVAYIRFASVYREFKDIRSFEKELRELRKNDQNQKM